MLARLSMSLTLALAGFIATTAPSFAALEGDRDDVMIWTALVVAGLLVVLMLAAAARHALGMDRMPEAEPDTHH